MIIDDGMRRMYGADPEDVFYYITLYNETYPMPPIPDDAQDGIIRGLYRYRPAPEPRAHRSQILASGTAMLAALEAQRLLANDHDVAADVWSATSYKQLRDDALSVERWNRLHPTGPPQRSYVAEALADVDGPIVAVTDFVKTVPDQIARWVPQPFIPLGTDGFGLSDTRTALRQHFEVDARHIVVATLHNLRDSLNAVYQAQTSPAIYANSVAFGQAVANDIFNFSRTDGGHKGYTTNFPASYVPPVGAGLWQPTPPLFAPIPLQPYWGNNRPVIPATNTTLVPPAPPAYSTTVGSTFYNYANEVHTVTSNLTTDQPNNSPR